MQVPSEDLDVGTPTSLVVLGLRDMFLNSYDCPPVWECSAVNFSPGLVTEPEHNDLWCRRHSEKQSNHLLERTEAMFQAIELCVQGDSCMCCDVLSLGLQLELPSIAWRERWHSQPAPTPQVSDSGGLGWDLRICISNMFPGDAYRPGTTLRNPPFCSITRRMSLCSTR